MILALIAALVIAVASALAVFLPVLKSVHPRLLFLGQHFGTGVILATGLVHLLEPAVEALEDISEYPVAYTLCLAMIFVVLLVDGLQRRAGHSHSHSYTEVDVEEEKSGSAAKIIILESGILLHSIFIGISCAFADSYALPCAIVVHQTFEGIGLGARLNAVKWDKDWKPQVLAWGYALATPFGIMMGLTAGHVSPTVTGVFDALSSGVLLYTALVELVAGEMLHIQPLVDWMLAYFSALMGAGLMAVLAEWV